MTLARPRISEFAYYIGDHANPTGIQRDQSTIVLALLRKPGNSVDRSDRLR